MDHLVAAMILAAVSFSQLPVANAQAGQTSRSVAGPLSEGESGDLMSLPSAPMGNSTILGGEIANVDPVRDRFTLRVFGQRQVKILFDERTRVYLDGDVIPLRDLRSHDHASVQTVLDGTTIFALSIHMLSNPPEGEYQGRVLSFNSVTNELTVSAVLSREPIKLLVPASTPIVREGQQAFSSAHPGQSDLVKGTLISVRFESNKRGRGVASQIAILATPGSEFVFSGHVSFLDMHSGAMVLVDPQDGKSYRVSFNSSRLPISKNIREGELLRVTATFDGARYMASKIAED